MSNWWDKDPEAKTENKPTKTASPAPAPAAQQTAPAQQRAPWELPTDATPTRGSAAPWANDPVVSEKGHSPDQGIQVLPDSGPQPPGGIHHGGLDNMQSTVGGDVSPPPAFALRHPSFNKPEDSYATILKKSIQNLPDNFKRQWAGLKIVGQEAPKRGVDRVLGIMDDIAKADQAGQKGDYLQAAGHKAKALSEGVRSTLLNPGDALTVAEAALFPKVFAKQFSKKKLAQAKKQYDQAVENIKHNLPRTNGRSRKYYFGSILDSTLNMGPSMTAAALLRNPEVGAALMSMQVYGDQYAQSRKMGRSPIESAQDATVFAAAEGLSEDIPLGVLTKEGGKRLKRMLKTAGAEGIQEILNQIIEDGYQKGIMTKDMTLAQGLKAMFTSGEMKRLADAGIIGSASGGILAGALHRKAHEQIKEEGGGNQGNGAVDAATLFGEHGQPGTQPNAEDLQTVAGASPGGIGGPATERGQTVKQAPETTPEPGTMPGASAPGVQAPAGDVANRVQAPDWTLGDQEVQPDQGPKYDNGIDFVSPRDELAGPPTPSAQQKQVAQKLTAAGKMRTETPPEQTRRLIAQRAKLPKGWKDMRLARPEFRDALERMGNDLTPGGDITYTHDEHGKINGRTPSINPDWYKNMDQEAKLPVKEAKRAIDKALAGKELGVKEGRFIHALIDQHSGERTAHGVDYAKQQLAKARELRKALGVSKFTPDPWGLDESEYDPELNARGRLMTDLAEKARSLGEKQADAAERLLERQISDEQVIRGLHKIIKEGSAHEQTQQEQKPAEGAQSAGDRAGAVSQEPGGGPNAEVGAEKGPVEKPPANGRRDYEIDTEDKGTFRAGLIRRDGDATIVPQNPDLPPVEYKSDFAKGKSDEELLRYAYEPIGYQGARELELKKEQTPAPHPHPEVEKASREAATHPENKTPEPTEAQKEAGNYPKGHVSIQGLDISIENPAGTKRRPEWPTLKHAYGYIRGTEGKDGDHVDVFIGPHPDNERVYVVNQHTPDGKRFDEHKVMLGFDSEQAARKAYLDNYTPGWKGLSSIVPMKMADFKAWLKHGDTKSRLVNTPDEFRAIRQRAREAQTSDSQKNQAQEVSPADLEKWAIEQIKDKVKALGNDALAVREVESTDFAIDEIWKDSPYVKDRHQNPQQYKAYVEARKKVDYKKIRKAIIGTEEMVPYGNDGRREKVQQAMAEGGASKVAQEIEQAKASESAKKQETADARAYLDGLGVKVKDTTTKNGNRVWEVSGDTRPHKETIKKLGGRWYGPKRVWSFYKGDPSARLAEALGMEKPAQTAPETPTEPASEAPAKAAPKAESVPQEPVSLPKGHKEVGVNHRGEKLYEDQNGVRYRREGGIAAHEPVPIIPGQKAMQPDVANRPQEFRTVAEDRANNPSPRAMIGPNQRKRLRQVMDSLIPQTDRPDAQKAVGHLEDALSKDGRLADLDAAETTLYRQYPPLAEVVGAVSDELQNAMKPRYGTPEWERQKAEQTKEGSAEALSRPADYGSKNKLVKQDAYEQARERLKKKLGQLNSGIDPEMLQDGMTLAAYHIEAGARAFHDYAKAMIADLGEAARPYLRAWYEGARHYPGMDTEGMTPPEEIDSAQAAEPAAPADQKQETAQSAGPAEAEPGANDIPDQPTARWFRQRVGDTLMADKDLAQAAKVNGFDNWRILYNEKADIALTDALTEAVDADKTVGGGIYDLAHRTLMNEAAARDIYQALRQGSKLKWASSRLPATEPTNEPGATERVRTANTAGPGGGESGAGGRVAPEEGARPGAAERPGRNGGGGEQRGSAVEKAVPGTRERRPDEAGTVRGLGPENGGDPGVRGAVLSPDAQGGAGRGAGRVKGRNWHIESDEQMGVGSPRVKLRHNLEAVRLLKQLKAEARPATAEEQAVLAKYAGWGGIPQAFNTWNTPDWAKAAADELETLLTDQEYEAARASTRNAHFTSKPVIDAMWTGLRRLGFDGGRVLEPAMGTGNFMGLVPRAVQGRTKFTGIELDPLTGEIAGQLYPGHDVRVSGFEKAGLPDGFYDAAISNVPFGDYRVHDPKYNKYKFFIHDYFFAKSLDKVRPGGVVAFVTSDGTMDKIDPKVRRYLAERADLLGAVRLPNDAFKKIANTEVTTDVIFLRKRAPGEKPAGEAWENTVTTEGKDGAQVRINEYFANHPEQMLGQMSLEGTMYGSNDQALVSDGRDLEKALGEAMDRLPENVMSRPQSDSEGSQQRAVDDLVPAPDVVKEGAFALHDGKVMRRENGNLVKATDTPRIRGMIKVRDSVRQVLRTQLTGASEQEVVAARQALNKAYDAFVKKHGYLNDRANRLAFRPDPDAPLLRSLEKYDPDTKKAEKSAIFERRTINTHQSVQKVDSPKDALVVSLNERGRVDLAHMADISGQPEEQLRQDLAGLIYENPETGELETEDAYLSGDVRAKLATAEAAAKIDGKYAENVNALREVQPPDLQAHEVVPKLGAPWVPVADVSAFANELMGGRGDSVKVQFNPVDAQWFVTGAKWGLNQTALTSTWGTRRADAITLLESALNQREPTVYDTIRAEGGERRVVNPTETAAAREKIQQIKSRFAEWLWEDDARRKRLLRKYNDEYNNLRARQFDGSHLTLPGSSGTIELRPHQKNAVWRIVQSGNTLLDHVVGAGKTYTMVAAGMEGKRLGVFKKPMYVVPNHMLGQFSAELLELYPTANILVASKDDLAGDKRRLLMSRIATGDWDAVIITHASFGKLPVSADFEARFIKKQIDEYEYTLLAAKEESGKGTRLVKDMEKRKQRLETRLEELSSREAKDDVVDFEELGIDQLFVDEAHLFKNLSTPTKLQINMAESKRAWDLYLKTNYLNELHGGDRGVVFASGTPISNSIAEMHVMQRYLQPSVLANHGLNHFDAWAATFGDSVTSLELSPDGNGFRMKTRFAKFSNVPELIAMYRQMADVQTQESLNLPIPEIQGGGPEVITADPSPALKAYVKTLGERADRVRNRGVDPSEDNMLKISTDGRKAALDLRLVDPAAGDYAGSKTNLMVDNAVKIWKETKARKSAQMIFLDFSSPSNKHFNVYDDIKAKLVAKGVPAAEIAYIHEATTDAKKADLFRKVRQGKVRFLLGSTSKMGAGTNAQTKLIAKHDLDAPWRPADIEQRDGRILRQGNENDQVGIYRYVTAGSFDGYMWQTLETKAKFLAQLKQGDVGRTMEDVDGAALSYAEIKALASGNPKVMEKAKVDAEVARLEALERAHRSQLYALRDELNGIPASRERMTKHRQRLSEDAATVADKTPAKFAVSLDGKTYTERKEAGARLIDIVRQANDKVGKKAKVIGQYAGLDLRIDPPQSAIVPARLMLVGSSTHEVSLSADPVGQMTRLENTAKDIASLRDQLDERLANQDQRETELKDLVNKPFDKAEELAKQHARQAQLATELDLDQQKNGEPGQAPQDDGGDWQIQEPNDGYDYGVRADASPETRRLGNEATHDLEAMSKPGRPVLRALGIAKELRETGSTSLVGQRVTGPDDLASLAQVYRDPRLETMRYFFVKDGKVVGQTGVSSRMPSSTAAFPAGLTRTEQTEWLKEQMQAAGADGYYMLHNHPSGNSSPSRADIRTTENLAEAVPGFLGHVVIDSNEYSIIDYQNSTGRGATHRTVEKDFGTDKLHQPGVEHVMLGATVRGPEHVAVIGKAAQAPDGWVTLIAGTRDKSGNGVVRAIADLPAHLLDKSDRLRATLRSFARQTGAQRVFLAGKGVHTSAAKDAYFAGLLDDAVSTDDGTSLHQVNVEHDPATTLGWSPAGQLVVDEDGDHLYSVPDHEISRKTMALMDKVGKGQPLDRAYRALFMPFMGGINEKGEGRLGAAVSHATHWMIHDANFKKTGPFSNWLHDVVYKARSSWLDRYNTPKDFVDEEFRHEADKRGREMAAAELAQKVASSVKDSAEARILHKMIVGEEIGPDELRGLSNEVREAIEQSADEAVLYGMISPESRERWRGKYLHRAYKDKEAEMGSLAKFGASLGRRYRRRLQGNWMKGRGIKIGDIGTERLLRNTPLDWWGRKLESGKADNELLGTKWRVFDRLAPIGEGTATAPGIEEGGPKRRRILDRVFLPADQEVPAKYQAWEDRGEWELRWNEKGKHILWRDFTPAEREQMGEILDARYTVTKTFMEMAHDLSTAKFFHDIATNQEWARPDEPPEGSVSPSKLGLYSEAEWVEVPNTAIPNTGGKKKWGALAGMYVRAEIFRDLSELQRMQQPGFWKAFMTQWKLNKTARNPVVHMNNILSNFTFMDLADVRLQDLVRGIVAYSERTDDFREAERYGTFGSNLISAEIRRDVLKPLLDEIRQETMDQSGYLEGMTAGTKLRVLGKLADRLWGHWKKFDNAMIHAYQMEDEVFRMAMYMRRRHLGDSPELAARQARDQFINYDIRAPAVNRLRQTVLPFFAYTYRSVPLIAHAVATRPWKIAKYATVGYLAQWMAYSLSGDDDQDRERRAMRDEVKGYTWIGVPRMLRVPGYDTHGNPLFLDVRRFIPAGDIFDTNQGQLPIPAPFQAGGPLMLGAELFLNRSAFTGDDIYDLKGKTTTENLSSVAGWAYRSWMPSAPYIPGSWYYDKIKRAARGGTDYFGQRYSVPLAALSSVGIKLRGLDVRGGLYWHAHDINALQDQYNFQYIRNERQYRRHLISGDEYLRNREIIKKKMKRLHEYAKKTLQGDDQ